MSGPIHDVLVVGAGVAGLAATAALAEAGADVLLVERRGFVGGRAYSYHHPSLNTVIDSQHVLVGCCTNLLDLCRRSGADQYLRWYDTIPFLTPSTASRPASISHLGTSALPAPLHAMPGFLSAAMLSSAEKISVATVLLGFLRGYPQDDSQPFSEWLSRHHQSPQSIRRFWEPIVIATLNDVCERISTRYAGQVFHEIFLRSSTGGRQAIPTLPLSEFFTLFATYAAQNNAQIEPNTSIVSIAHTDGVWFATAGDGSVHSANALILALPFEQTARLLTTLPPEASQRRILDDITHHTHAPFTTVHLWFDREITDLDQAALLDTRLQWMFNKSRIRQNSSEGHYIEAAIGGSFAELEMSRDEILDSSLDELARFFPAVRAAKVLRSGLLKEARATFSVAPGTEQYRPQADQHDGLFLAGDWAATGWPSTMEGAARSGRLAANAVAAWTGQAHDFLTPNLPPSGFMRWLL